MFPKVEDDIYPKQLFKDTFSCINFLNVQVCDATRPDNTTKGWSKNISLKNLLQ